MQLRKGALALALLALGASATAQSIVQTREVLTNPAIITLASAGFNEDFVIELILNSKTQFDTSVDGLSSLAKQGINERIIRVMLSAENAGVGTTEAQPMTRVVRPDPDPVHRIVVFKPEPAVLAISAHTPYYDSISLFWGFFKRKVGVGVAPQVRDTLVPHLGLVYGSVLSPGVLVPVGMH